MCLHLRCNAHIPSSTSINAVLVAMAISSARLRARRRQRERKLDDARLDTLFLALPVSWQGTLVQYTGGRHRLHPGKCEVRIFDYDDSNVPMLRCMSRSGFADIARSATREVRRRLEQLLVSRRYTRAAVVDL
jgi:hypothetical protein